MNSNAALGAHALLIAKDGSIILQQKTLDYAFNPLNRGKLSMFGGGAELNEEPFDTLQRELKEELKLDISDKPVLELNTYRKNIEEDGTELDVHVFTIRNIDKEKLFVDPKDSSEGTAGLVIDTIGNFLKNSNLSRVTRLALLDYQKTV